MHGTLNSHVLWAAGYWFAELLNLVNVVANALMLDALLGGRFFSYGALVLGGAGGATDAPIHPQLLQRLQRLDPYPDFAESQLSQLGGPADPGDHPEDPADPMEAVFPKLTKCTFFKYGPSGSIQRHDALCVMALNVVNEKVRASGDCSALCGFGRRTLLSAHSRCRCLCCCGSGSRCLSSRPSS